MGFPTPGTDNEALRGILAELQAQRGARDPFEGLFLERQQEDLLAELVEAERRISREQSHPFILVATLGEGYSLVHTGLVDLPVMPADVRTLADAGLLRRGVGGQGSETYEVAPRGRAYYVWMKERERSSTDHVETEVHRFLDGAGFRGRHPQAYDRWTEAEAALWGAETAGQFTDIGHSCREAIQFFITDLVDHHKPGSVEPDPQKTVARLKVVLATSRLSKSVTAFAEALLAYFGTVSDLVQRQEHGGQKEGEPLRWEDARRVVFQTAVVMFELDRVLG